jgi:hypothetical protein
MYRVAQPTVAGATLPTPGFFGAGLGAPSRRAMTFTLLTGGLGANYQQIATAAQIAATDAQIVDLTVFQKATGTLPIYKDWRLYAAGGGALLLIMFTAALAKKARRREEGARAASAPAAAAPMAFKIVPA